MTYSDEDRVRSRRPGAEDAYGRIDQVLGGRAIDRSGGTVAVYTVHMVTRNADFLVEPQNHGQRFVSGLASKPVERFSPVWPQNQWRGFPGLGLKTGGTGFPI
jgi:hypothetical protein